MDKANETKLYPTKNNQTTGSCSLPCITQSSRKHATFPPAH